MKRSISLLLVICLLLPSTALAFCEEGDSGFTVTQSDNQGEITFVIHPPNKPVYNAPAPAPKPTVEPPTTTGKPSTEKVPKGNLVKVTDVKGAYKKGSVYGPKLSTKELQQVKQSVIMAVNACIREGMSDGQKIVALVNYLCDQVSYADDWSKNKANTAWGALCYGAAQCSGYARAMIALLDAVGIESKYVHASKKAINPSHQWIVVKYGGQWYHLDPQGIDDYMVINTTTMTVSYPRPIVLMSSYMPYETKGIPKTANQDITLQ